MSTDIALRRLVDALKTSADKRVVSAASSIAAEMDSAISADIAAHAAKTQFVHGVGSLFVAKTSNPTQYVRWSEIADKPDLSDLDIGTSGLEIDASQVTTGTFVLARLPVADGGESDTQKLVRSDDVRLQTKSFFVEVGESLLAGHFVTIYNNNGTKKCKPADATSTDTLAVGFVNQGYGIGQTAEIFPFGNNTQVYIPGLTSTSQMKPIRLGTGGYAITGPPSDVPGTIIQDLGIIISVVSTTIAEAMIIPQTYQIVR